MASFCCNMVEVADVVLASKISKERVRCTIRAAEDSPDLSTFWRSLLERMNPSMLTWPTPSIQENYGVLSHGLRGRANLTRFFVSEQSKQLAYLIR